MQAKPDTTLANSVAEIVKTFISHPDHGLNASEIPTMIREIVTAFKEATLSDLAVTSTAQPALPAPVPESTASVASESSVSQETSRPAARKARRGREASAEVATEAEASTEAPAEVPAEEQAPAAPSGPLTLEQRFGGKISRKPIMDPQKAIEHNAIICLIDGVPKKMLHRWIRSKYQMEPHEYREWFNLPEDYPMTAPGYSKEKSDYAKTVGLGTAEFSGRSKRSEDVAAEAPAEAVAAKAPKATPKTSRRKRGEDKSRKTRSRAEENA